MSALPIILDGVIKPQRFVVALHKKVNMLEITSHGGIITCKDKLFLYYCEIIRKYPIK
jgi:hypothetical protein